MTEPTNEQIEAVANHLDHGRCSRAAHRNSFDAARALLTSTDPDLWAAIAAHIPLDALAQAGRLEVEWLHEPSGAVFRTRGSAERHRETWNHQITSADPSSPYAAPGVGITHRLVSAWEVQE